MSATTKISIYSLPDLKNTSDDALPNYLNSLGFKQSHYLSDVRLLLGYSAVAIAGALFWADWKLGWDETRAWTLPAVVVYFILNGIFTWWLLWVEKGVVYVGFKDGVKVSLNKINLDEMILIHSYSCP
jgi:Microsomal signal peptidase 25 kDa subunit (SPC25)